MSTKVKVTALTGVPVPAFPTQRELLANENQMGPTLKVSLHPQRKIYVTSQQSWLRKLKKKKKKKRYFIFQNGKVVPEQWERGCVHRCNLQFTVKIKTKQNVLQQCTQSIKPGSYQQLGSHCWRALQRGRQQSARLISISWPLDFNYP